MRLTTTDTFPAELDGIAETSPGATFFHTSTWANGLRGAFPGFSFRCIVAEDGGEIHGYLPYFLIKRGPFALAWSMPFGTYGGPVVKGGDGSERDTIAASEHARVATDTHRALIERFNGDTAGVRIVDAGWVDYGSLHVAAGDHVAETHVVSLADGFDRLWAERFARQRRQRTRRAEKLGVTVRAAERDADLSRFYEIYAERMRALASPDVYPREVFDRLIGDGEPGRVRLFVAEHDGRIVGGHFNFYFRDTAFIWYGVTTAEGDKVQAGTLLYVSCIRDACDSGMRHYNLGSSLGKASLIDFKESLGGVAREYRVHHRRSALGRLLAGTKRLLRRNHG